MWNDLTMSERADVIKMAVKAGLRDMKSIRKFYDNSLKYADGGPKVTLVDNDKVRMSPSGTFSDDNGNIIGDSIVLPEITIRARDDKKHVGEYKSTFNPSGAAEFAGTVLNSPLMLADKGINKLGINGTPVQTTAQRVGETLSPTRWAGTLKTGFKESPWSENNPGLWGDRNIDMMTDLVIGAGLSKVPYSKIATNVSNTANSYKYLKAIEKAPINSDKLLNDAMLNDLSFVNGAIRNKSALAPKTVEDVVSFTYGLPKGINPKTKLSRLTSNQIYDLVLRDLQRENPNNWFIGVGNSAKNNRYIHMDANSSIIPTTEGFLPTREGFTKVGRYGTPEIWYNKNIPYYPRELSSTPRSVVTTKKALGIEDAFDNVAHTPKTLKYEDILYGLEPNEFGSYNKVLYAPYKKAPLSNTPYNPSIDPNNLFNIQQSLARTKSLEELIPRYNEFAKFYDYNIMVKKANFAKNASKWKHGLGGYLFI